MSSDPVLHLMQVARRPVGDIETYVDTPRQSTRPGSGARQVGSALGAVLLLGITGAGVAYAAKPVGTALAGYVIEGQERLREHCMRNLPSVR